METPERSLEELLGEAVARGIITAFSLEADQVHLRTDELNTTMTRRQARMMLAAILQNTAPPPLPPPEGPQA